MTTPTEGVTRNPAETVEQTVERIVREYREKKLKFTYTDELWKHDAENAPYITEQIAIATRAYQAALSTVGWVRTDSERRPEFDSEFLICNEGPQDASFAHYFGDEQVDCDRSVGPWGWCFTHWMPIPPLPQQQ